MIAERASPSSWRVGGGRGGGGGLVGRAGRGEEDRETFSELEVAFSTPSWGNSRGGVGVGSRRRIKLEKKPERRFEED